ncbi:MAG: helix-turn-helix domain-containing protein [Firmicutes bacterium]|nr:helix-turn-helix domain-containing protein [Bacillota bacterium]
MEKKKNICFRIFDWMIDIRLKNNYLLVYALIYSFSCRNDKVFCASLRYICDRVNMSKTAVIEALKYLVSNGYIIKESYVLNGVSRVKYKYSADKLVEMGVVESVHENPKANTFFIVYDWMVKWLHLSGHELTTYALLYSFRYSENKALVGSFAYIAGRINTSELTARRCIDKLEHSGRIDYTVILKKDKHRIHIFKANTLEEIEASYSLNTQSDKNVSDSLYSEPIKTKKPARVKNTENKTKTGTNENIIYAKPEHKSNSTVWNNNAVCTKSEHENTDNEVSRTMTAVQELVLLQLLRYILTSKARSVGYSMCKNISPELVEQLRDFRDNVNLVLFEYDSMSYELPAFLADDS